MKTVWANYKCTGNYKFVCTGLLRPETYMYNLPVLVCMHEEIASAGPHTLHVQNALARMYRPRVSMLQEMGGNDPLRSHPPPGA
jgi:hypothetical protein